ncbi:MAG TPA: hypothetical protein VKY74_21800 [Chloroflexia bacterium]|nr:hypothetical protein [Chloroflexia bacterium]
MRDQYQILRQFTVNYRRARVAHLVRHYGLGRGQQARMARALGVSPTTISRDVATLLALVAPCPYCGSYPLLVDSRQDGTLAAALSRVSGSGADVVV